MIVQGQFVIWFLHAYLIYKLNTQDCIARILSFFLTFFIQFEEGSFASQDRTDASLRGAEDEELAEALYLYER